MGKTGRAERWRRLTAASCAAMLAAACRGRPAEVRVALAVGVPAVEVWSAGPLELRDAATGRPAGHVPAGTVARFVADSLDPGLLLTPGGARSLAATVGVEPAGERTVRVDGVPYRGALRVAWTAPGRLAVVNRLPLEAYLRGVVPRELGPVDARASEALMAQAVASRTYALLRMRQHAGFGFDVFAGEADQVYGGAAAETEAASRAVRATRGEILAVAGAPIEAFFHSTCAGRTAAADEVWGGPRRPYLAGGADVDPRTGAAWDAASPRSRWRVRWEGRALARILASALADSFARAEHGVGELQDLRVVSRGPSGRVSALTVRMTDGTVVLRGDGLRRVLRAPDAQPLYSTYFDLRVRRDDAGRITEVVATGRGWGHGVGMCQFGALGRASAGQRYREILNAYYPGARLTRAY